MISPCSTEVLASALVGNLPPDREEALQRHLEQCEKCSAALERMAGGAPWCEEAALLLGDDDSGDGAPAREDWSLIDFTVEHLEPADDPNLLGRLGGYDILEIIGRGGMGVVLKGFDRELKRCVAIKVLAPHLAQSPLAKKRFAREAQAAAAVVHPHVLAIHQVQASGRLPFLVMPLVAGESLAQRLAVQGRLEVKEILRIGMQAAAGLAAAHEQGLVHRDVKPANILLEKGVERAVLTDFGLARAADDVTITRWGFVSGTPQYMSPEQARDEALDGRSDLFSLGCVLYEMATGVSPFRAETTVATLRRLVDGLPPDMASLNPELPPWLVAITLRLLAKYPEQRFASAKEVSDLLEGCLAHVQQPASVALPDAIPESPHTLFSWIHGRFLAGGTLMLALALAFAYFFFGPPGKAPSETLAAGVAGEPPAAGAPAVDVPQSTLADPNRAPSNSQYGYSAMDSFFRQIGSSAADDEADLRQIFRAILPTSCSQEIAKQNRININSCTGCHQSSTGEGTATVEADQKSTEARVARLEAAIRQIQRLLADRQGSAARDELKKAREAGRAGAGAIHVVILSGKRTYLIDADPKRATLSALTSQQILWKSVFTELLPVYKGGDWAIDDTADKEVVLRYTPDSKAIPRLSLVFRFNTNTGLLLGQGTELVADPDNHFQNRTPRAAPAAVPATPAADPKAPPAGDPRATRAGMPDARLLDLEKALMNLGWARKGDRVVGPPIERAEPPLPVARPVRAAEEGDLSELGVRYLDAIAECKLLKSRLARLKAIAAAKAASAEELEEAEISLENATRKQQLLAGLVEGGHRAAVAARAATATELRRYQELWKSGLVAQGELDAFQARADAADVRVQQYETILKVTGGGATGTMPSAPGVGVPMSGPSGTPPFAPNAPSGIPGASGPALPPPLIPGLPAPPGAGQPLPPSAGTPAAPTIPGSAAPAAPPIGLPGASPPAASGFPPLLERLFTPRSAAAAQSVNHLKQIGLALHTFHDARGRFPAAELVREGKPLLSWRVAILPYLDQEELYRQFHLDEPWDSPHNVKLVERMPKVFQSPGLKPGHTIYLAATGKGLLFDGDQERKISDILDGTSNTIMVLEASPDRSVPWTKPADLLIDLSAPAAGLMGPDFGALFCDGSVRVLKLPIDAKNFANMLQIADGNPIKQ